MAALPKGKKGLRLGTRVILVGTLISGYVMEKVASYRKTRVVVKPPKVSNVAAPIYKVTAELPQYSLYFGKRKDAECYKKMLAKSGSQIKSDIVRQEITDDGYHVEGEQNA